MIARAVGLTHSPSSSAICIITNHPEEWDNFRKDENAGIYPIQHKPLQDIIEITCEWAHNNKGNHNLVLLLVDDLDAIAKLGGLSGTKSTLAAPARTQTPGMADHYIEFSEGN